MFTKVRKDSPKDELSKNAQLLIKAGYINKEMAGVYSMLPLGLRVNDRIKSVIRTHMNKLGGQEIHMSALQNPDVWKATDRWNDDVVDNWFKTRLKSDAEVGLGFTHEEPITSMMKQHISSYTDLPAFVYQFQYKFRNELRAKSGLMRGREFEMKDLYSFCKTEEEQKAFFEKAKDAYVAIFRDLGLGDVVHVTYASGGVFSKYSIEFQAVSDAGEDIIYVDNKTGIAMNKEIFSDETCAEFGIDPKAVVEKKSIEVGNIFNLGTRFSDALGLSYTDDKNQKQSVWMGSYGIGVGRLVGTIAELYADEDGLVWPKEVAPYQVIVVALQDDREVQDEAEKIYLALQKNGIEAMLHDKKGNPGEKLATADMLGIPRQVIVSKKALLEGKFEIKDRKTKQVTYKTFFDIVEGDL
jgi:prolyl-tRNA synthetase